MITYSVLGKSWKCRKCQNGYCRFEQVLGRDRGFQVTTEFLVLCRDNGFLCRDKGSLCSDKWFLMSQQGFPVSRHGSQAAGSFLVAT